MAKSALEVAIMLDVMVNLSKTKILAKRYTSCSRESWKGISLGAVDVEPWLLSSFLVKPVEIATRQEVRSPKHTRKVYCH